MNGMLLAVAALVCASGDWYRPALYPYCDHAAGAGWAAGAQSVRFDNPELNRLDVFRDAVPVYHAQRRTRVRSYPGRRPADSPVEGAMRGCSNNNSNIFSLTLIP